MTAPSILVAWLLTALFSALMLWRLRILMRGDAVVGRAEAASYGALMATIMGGSVVLYLAATPFIYSEDFAWSIPLTLGSLFALLGVLERPSRGPGHCERRAHPVRHPQPVPARLGLLHRRPPHRGMVRAGTGRRRPTGGGPSRWWPSAWSHSSSAVWSPTPSSASPSACPWPTRSGPPSTPTAATSWPPTAVRLSASAFLPSTLSAYFQPLGIRIGGHLPVHHSARGSRPVARRRSARPDLPHRQLHGHQSTPPPPRLLGRDHSFSTAGNRTGAVDPDHPARSRGRRGWCAAVGIHLTAVPGGPDALLHHRRAASASSTCGADWKTALDGSEALCSVRSWPSAPTASPRTWPSRPSP